MRPEKEQLVKDICGLIEPSPCLFLVTYKGLTAQAFEELRTTLEASAAQCHVVPNRLFKRAAAVCGMESVLETDLRGDTALVCGPETNPVTLAKTLTTFGKTHPQLTFKLGVIDGKPFGPDQAQELAKLPPREILLAQLLGLLQAPARQLVSVLNAKTTSVVYVLSAYLQNKEETAS